MKSLGLCLRTSRRGKEKREEHQKQSSDDLIDEILRATSDFRGYVELFQG